MTTDRNLIDKPLDVLTEGTVIGFSYNNKYHEITSITFRYDNMYYIFKVSDTTINPCGRGSKSS
jgi:hypothetical protein